MLLRFLFRVLAASTSLSSCVSPEKNVHRSYLQNLYKLSKRQKHLSIVVKTKRKINLLKNDALFFRLYIINLLQKELCSYVRTYVTYVCIYVFMHVCMLYVCMVCVTHIFVKGKTSYCFKCQVYCKSYKKITPTFFNIELHRKFVRKKDNKIIAKFGKTSLYSDTHPL